MNEHIRVLTHSSIRIEDGAHIIYIDPFQIREESHDADFVLITHDHYDHFSPEDVAKVIRDDTKIIMPEGMRKKGAEVVPAGGTLYTVQPGSVCEIGGFIVETVPAYNIVKPFHPRSAGWVGYILRVDGKRVYIAGDTDMTVDNSRISCEIALIPIGGTYTMDARKAAELVNSIRPEIAIPTHYGGAVGKEEDAQTFSEHVRPPIKVEILKEY